jgi:cytochrome P450
LLSNTLLAFEENPGQRALLVADPSLMPDAIEEVLRWRSTVQMIPRGWRRTSRCAAWTSVPRSSYVAQNAASSTSPRWSRRGEAPD